MSKLLQYKGLLSNALGTLPREALTVLRRTGNFAELARKYHLAKKRKNFKQSCL
jgi:hypothetical protein